MQKKQTKPKPNGRAGGGKLEKYKTGPFWKREKEQNNIKKSMGSSYRRKIINDLT